MTREFSSVWNHELEQVSLKYEAVIGIEVHCQLWTQSKLFARADSEPGPEPNVSIDEVTLGLPGSLPVLNRACVERAVRMGLALKSQIHPVSIFERKNYFYPDLPKGYQITQFDRPICSGGSIQLAGGRRVRIDRIQLEEDAGKLVHHHGFSAVDFNRAGVALIEIVSHPDLRSPREVWEYVRVLHRLAVYYEITRGDLDRGHFRADANVSLRPLGQEEYGTRVELKNINSFRFLERAVASEILRQADLLGRGVCIKMETRGFDSERDCTFSQRVKETATDYRYFPDPDLPPLVLDPELLLRLQQEMPLTLEEVEGRFGGEWGLNEQEVQILTETCQVSQLFLEVAQLLSRATPKQLAGFWVAEQPHVVLGGAFSGWLAAALDVMASGQVSLKVLRESWKQAYESGLDYLTFATRAALLQNSDKEELLRMLKGLLDQYPEQAEQLRGGKDKLLSFFVGKAMKDSGGRINAALLKELLLGLMKEG
jgi:aspartyl-tRNA(Asn)/glutamyl-tRNA(Gln) amidotransferase subunit B